MRIGMSVCQNSTPVKVSVPFCPKTRLVCNAGRLQAPSFRESAVHHRFQSSAEMPGGMPSVGRRVHNLGVQIQWRHKRQICRQTARDVQWKKRDGRSTTLRNSRGPPGVSRPLRGSFTSLSDILAKMKYRRTIYSRFTWIIAMPSATNDAHAESKSGRITGARLEEES